MATLGGKPTSWISQASSLSIVQQGLLGENRDVHTVCKCVKVAHVVNSKVNEQPNILGVHVLCWQFTNFHSCRNSVYQALFSPNREPMGRGQIIPHPSEHCRNSSQMIAECIHHNTVLKWLCYAWNSPCQADSLYLTQRCLALPSH